VRIPSARDVWRIFAKSKLADSNKIKAFTESVNKKEIVGLAQSWHGSKCKGDIGKNVMNAEACKAFMDETIDKWLAYKSH